MPIPRLTSIAALPLLLLLPTASAAQTGSASGSIDGQPLELALDCSNWGEQPYASIAAADKNEQFEGTRFPDGNFALTWKPGDHTYQMLFGGTEPGQSFELAETFSSEKLGRSYEATVTIDCGAG